MRNAHLLSAGLSPDPFYDAARRLPTARDSALFGEVVSGAAPCWLYVPGDLEGYLMARMRREAFSICTGIFHPGAFNRPHALAAFHRSLNFDTVPARFPVSLWHSGELRLDINGVLLLRSPQSSSPREVIADLSRLLRPGENEIQITVTRLDEPPCLLVDGPGLITDARWTCGTNLIAKIPAAPFPSAGTRWFPHQENLPTARLAVPVSTEGLADFGCVLLGRPLLPPADFAGLGESVCETLDTHAVPEQRPLFDDEGARAFQFVAVRGGTHASGRLEAEVSLHPVRYAGAFACSDERLTRIWHHAAATLRMSLRELTVDGLKRDRLPWAGDAYIATLGNAAVFGEHRCIRRTITALAPEDPALCPTNGIIDYDAHWIIAVTAQWLFDGDNAAARTLWPEVERLLAALHAREDQDGFLRHEGTWLFLDWIDFDKARRSVALQALHVGALQAAAVLARGLGYEECAVRLRSQAARLGEAIRTTCWSFEEKPGTPVVPAGRHAAFLSELFGILPPSLAGREISGPPTATAYMRTFEAMARSRRGDQAAMLEGVRSYWGGMLDRGATTFWEGYDPALPDRERYAFYNRPFGKSLCHAWACGPLPLLSFELAGLRPTAAGWSEVVCQPSAVPLDWACATFPTPHGELRWEYESGQLRVEAPPGITLHCDRGTRSGNVLTLALGDA